VIKKVLTPTQPVSHLIFDILRLRKESAFMNCTHEEMREFPGPERELKGGQSKTEW
jgi:hypothetical protein